MNKNLKLNQIEYTQTPLPQNYLKQLIPVTVQVLIAGVNVALCSVPAQAWVESVDQKFQQEFKQRDSIAVNRNLNRSSEFRNDPTQNAVDLKSTSDQKLSISIQTKKSQNCWLYPGLPGCSGGGW